MSSNTKDLHQAIAAAQLRGWTLVRKTSGGHYKLQWPWGGRSVFTSGTPSDWRVVHNLNSELSRIEKEFPAPEVVIKPKVKTVVQSIDELPPLGKLGDFMQVLKKDETLKFKTRITKTDKLLRLTLPKELSGMRFEAMWDKGKLCIAESHAKNSVKSSVSCVSGSGKNYYSVTFSSKLWVPKMPNGSIVIDVEWVKDCVIVDLETPAFAPKVKKEPSLTIVKEPAIVAQIPHDVVGLKGIVDVLNEIRVPLVTPDPPPQQPKTTREVMRTMIDRINNFCEKNNFVPEIVNGKIRLIKNEVIG